MKMDLLSDLLRTMRLSGAVFLESAMSTRWCYLTPTPESLREELVPGERVMAFHLLAEGSCIVWLPGQAPMELKAGELVLFPQGNQHILASSLDAIDSLRPKEVRCDAIRSMARQGQRERCHFPSVGSTSTTLICGYMACGGYDSIPVLADLPPILRLTGNQELSAWMRASMKYCLLECGSEQPGAALVVEKIAELMLLQALRQHLSEAVSKTAESCFTSARDKYLRKAVLLIHADPAREWTVEELSRRVGLSRSALAMRFVQHLGEPPMQHLARWRITLAADALKSTCDPVMQIAGRVGYQSEAAFNRAFKRLYGIPPAKWRKEVAQQLST